jgi:uncharacterized protein (TIGR03067 family)
MYWRWLLALTAILGLTAFAPAPFEKPDKKATSPRELQGTWSVVSVDRGGGVKTLPRNARAKVRIDKDTWTFLTTIRDRARETRYFLVLDPKKNPKQFDLKRQADGPVTLRGIYHLEGDTLKVVYANPLRDTARPASFSSLQADQYLLTLKRDKP